jgi:nucleolar protein 15
LTNAAALSEPEPAPKKAKASKEAEKRKGSSQSSKPYCYPKIADIVTLTASEDTTPVAVKKQKPSKDAATNKAAEPKATTKQPTETKTAPKKSALKKDKKAPKETAKTESKKAKKPVEEEEQANNEIPSDVEEEEVDEETQALVEALDSGDEQEDDAQVSTYKKGQDVGKIPKAKKPSKASAAATADDSKPGVMYLARLPHGFYEHELRAYFGQFGEITRLRVVRNKKTGASRHRAFIEFADAEVADIAARTMDKYLLFGHILTAKIVPPSQVHPDLFKGANRRFKVVPWNKMAGRQLERPLSESQWQAKIAKEEQRRAARAEKLKELGYEYEPPALKAPEAKPLLENGGAEEAPKAIEAPPAAEEETKAEEKEEEEEKQGVEAKTTKATKAKKAKAEKTEKTGEEATAPKKGKQSKKTKS